MRSVLLVLFAACSGSKPTTNVPEADTDADADADADADTDVPSGTDDDGDGWTVEDGDCDDADIWINPGWLEQSNDDKDNDCDGRTDEEFAGVWTLQVNTAGAETSKWQRIDPLGDLKETVDTGVPLGIGWMEEKPDHSGYYGWDESGPTLYEIGLDGSVTELATLPATDDPAWELAPFVLWNVAAHPDGYALVSGANQLIRVNPDGSWEVVATWNAFAEEETDTGIAVVHDIAVTALATNPLTGTVAMWGYLGGFAEWHPDTGFKLIIPEDIEADPMGTFTYGQSDERGNLYALGTMFDSDGVGTIGIYKWNGTNHVLKGPWVSTDGSSLSSYTPRSFGIMSEVASGAPDFYVTANGGWYRTVWRVVSSDGYATQLWTNELGDPPDTAEANRSFWPLSVLWASD